MKKTTENMVEIGTSVGTFYSKYFTLPLYQAEKIHPVNFGIDYANGDIEDEPKVYIDEVDIDEIMDEELLGGLNTIRELLEDEGYILSDDDFIFLKDDLEIIAAVSVYYTGTDIVDSTTTFYKVGVDRDGDTIYTVNPENEDGYYVYEDFIDMVDDYTNKIEIWNQFDDEAKERYFGEDLEDIDTIVEIDNDSVVITASTELTEDNPAYSFGYIGITNEKELVIYTVNNCNTQQSDRPKGDYVTMAGLVKGNNANDPIRQDKNGNYIFIPSDEDLKTIFDFWMENK